MKLWRYMDFNKFSKFIKGGALYFCGARNFEDVFEGEYAWGKTGHKRFLEVQKALHPTCGGGMPFDDFMMLNLKTLNDISNKTYINCWHQSPHESEAMWKLYCSEIETGVVVETTEDELRKHLKGKNLPKLQFGAVKYVPNFWIKNYNPESTVYFSKRVSFEHEKEFRAIFQEDANDGTSGRHGVPVAVDMNSLIKSIRISPFGSASLKAEVENLLQVSGISVSVDFSEIETHPIMSASERILSEGPGWRQSIVSLERNHRR